MTWPGATALHINLFRAAQPMATTSLNERSFSILRTTIDTHNEAGGEFVRPREDGAGARGKGAQRDHCA